MVFSLGLGLMAHNNIHTFSYGYDKLRFIKPVFIGDTIYTIRTHKEKWPKYPELGMVKVSYEVFKVPGELVLYCEHLQTVKYRTRRRSKMKPGTSDVQGCPQGHRSQDARCATARTAKAARMIAMPAARKRLLAGRLRPILP